MKKGILAAVLMIPWLVLAQMAEPELSPDALLGEVLPPPQVSPPFSVSSLFDQYKSSVYQIRVINEATSQKTSIGSGFVIGEGDFLASNYHVVSDAVQKEHHRLEYVDENDQSGALAIVAVDVIHDLAILRAEKSLGNPLQLGPVPNQGAPLYALGNPHDLGFVIIDGINNGLLKKSARGQLLFSGSLNGGMSGGPTLDQQGKVVGVNVAYLASGNNISFIIPAEYLRTLLDQALATEGEPDINAAITEQLFADNALYFADSLASVWPSTTIAHFSLPLAMSNDVRCWDSSPEPDVDDMLGMESVSCFNDRSTFINDDVTIGQFGYSYTHYYAREPLLTSRFYRLYSQDYQMHFSQRSQRDYGDFQCEAGFVEIAGKPFKTTLCSQPSKQFVKQGEAIEDVRLMAAQIGPEQEGFKIEIGMNGVQQTLAREVMAHLLEQIQWQN